MAEEKSIEHVEDKQLIKGQKDKKPAWIYKLFFSYLLNKQQCKMSESFFF